MTTKLAISYAIALEVIHRTIDKPGSLSAVDLACGPGHFTLSLAKYLGYNRVTGVDLSPPMVAVAEANAKASGLRDTVGFQVGDVTDLSFIAAASVDLACFTDAAHHMPTLDMVGRVVHEMDRVTKPHGLVMLMDLARLRTESLTERYVNTLASDYAKRGLPQFFDDFRNSMYAAWTTAELRSAIPRNSMRWWCQIVPRGLPTVQIVLGLPVGRRVPFLRRGWRTVDHPLIQECYPNWVKDPGPKWAHETLSELKMMRLSLKFASRSFIPPRR